MTIYQILIEAREIGKNIPEVNLAIEVLLSFVLKKPKEFFICNKDYHIEPEDENFFWNLFYRHKEGVPVAYLINNKEFYGLNFYVDKRVLIPRPETELLVEKVLEAAGKISKFALCSNPGEIKILEIGTGSGCISIAIAKNLPNAKIVAVEISEDALEVAKKNALSNGVESRISFIKSDLMEKVNGSFDIVVANLPYIGEQRFKFVSKEAFDYEPHLALFGGENGLFLYQRLFEELNQQAWKPKLLLGEFGFLQGEEMRLLLNKYFIQQSCGILKDLASIERIFMVGFVPEFLQNNDK